LAIEEDIQILSCTGRFNAGIPEGSLWNLM
jgi:hypothetical protein